MKRKEVVSSVIKSIGFNSGVLEIEFRNGGIYRYWHVPKKVYIELMKAESIGKYYHKNIRGVYPKTKIK